MKISILVSLQLYKNYFYAFFRFGVIYNIIYSFLNIFCYFVVLLALYELDSNGSIWSVYKRCTQVHGRALIHKLVSPANKCFNYFKWREQLGNICLDLECSIIENIIGFI